MLRTDIAHRDKLASYLKAHPATNNLYKINNGYDFLLEGVFVHIKQLEDFLEELEAKFNIQDTQTYHVIDDIKREAFLSVAIV